MTGRGNTGLDATTRELFRAAVGLAAIHFPLPDRAVPVGQGTTWVSSRDVAFLLDGHVDVWPEWPGLDPEDTALVVRLLRARRPEYADGELIRRDLRSALHTSQLPGCTLIDDADDQLVVGCSPGMPLRDFVAEALDTLEQRTSVGRGRTPVAQPGSYHTSVLASAGTTGRARSIDQRYQIPLHAIAAKPVAPQLTTSSPVDEVPVSAAELIEVADRIDAARSGPDYRGRHIRRLLRRLRTTTGEVTLAGVLALVAGQVRLLNAPTGVGKSVAVEVLAAWAALRGLVITIVVPNNTAVLTLTHAIEEDLAALGAAGSVTALMSPSSMFEAARKVIAARPGWDPGGEWTMDRLGYGCALSAAVENEDGVEAWQPGREPCTALQAAGDSHGQRYACPWRMTCGKFRLARAALTASVMVTSHANLHSGRLHLPVDDGRGVTDRTTVEELVFRRSHLVVIDEIDAFQSDVLSQAARGLLMDRRGSTDTPLFELERGFVSAAGRINRDVETSVRGMIHHSKFLASSYTAALDHGLIGTSHPGSRSATGRYWVVPRRWDGVLTAQLFGLPESQPLTAEMLTAFRSLFPGGDPSTAAEPSSFSAVRRILAAVTEVGGGAGDLEDARLALDSALADSIPDTADRGRAINRLLQRTILERLRTHLRRFVYDAPHLAAAGVGAAQQIAETFGPYSRWRALPTGPLGRLLFAFSHHFDPTGSQPTRLNAAAFGGDPHTYTTTLGDITALCRAGTRRAVLGLSATAYFPLAPHHHVHLEPTWWASDTDADGVTIRPAYVPDRTGDESRLVRVSGSEGARRDEAIRRLTELLWRSRLDKELVRLAAEDPNRARILLATTSSRAPTWPPRGLSAPARTRAASAWPFAPPRTPTPTTAAGRPRAGASWPPTGSRSSPSSAARTSSSHRWPGSSAVSTSSAPVTAPRWDRSGCSCGRCPSSTNPPS